MKKLTYILILIFISSTIAISQSQEKKVLKKEIKVEKKESCSSKEESLKKTIKEESCDVTDKNTNADEKTEEESCCSVDNKSTKNKETKINDNSNSETLKPFNLVCPVTGEEIEPDQAKTVTYNGKVYGFCCPGCVDKFNKDPETYIKNLSEDGKTFLKN